MRLSLSHPTGVLGALIGVLAAAFPASTYAQQKKPAEPAPVDPYERDEPIPAKPPEAPIDPYEPPPSKPSVEYGAVDAATVRVFAIGTVGTTKLTVRGYQISVADPEAGHGTGFAVGDGLIVTARHVVEDAQHIVVRLPGEGGFFAARMMYEDKDSDVAVIHIDGTVPALQLSSGSTLRVRQTVFAIGYPLDPTRTQAQSARGIVAGQKDDDTIQLDMALNPGNSGGPLVDEKDRVVGMVVARGNPEKGVQGIGFAVRTERLAAAIKEAKGRLDGGQVDELTDRQKQSAVVVDELVQQGVFHDIRATADVKDDLRSADVQKSLDSLISRIEDPDLLVFVGAQLWNVYVALWAAEDADLDSVGLTREKANDLANRFGYTSGTACRKAKKLDASISARSPIVDVVLATWRSSEPPAKPEAAARTTASFVPHPQVASETTTSHVDVLLRTGLETAYVPSVGFGLGVGLGVGLVFKELGFKVGTLTLIPYVGLDWGLVNMAVDEDGPGGFPSKSLAHSYLAGDIGFLARIPFRKNRQGEVAVVWAPGFYEIDPQDEETQDELIAGHVRVEGNYRWRVFAVGVSAQVFQGPTYWFQPVVLSLLF